MAISSILDLDNDAMFAILGIITMENPDRHMITERPLAVVRTVSQVCQQWRELLLGSPWIWGRLVDLGVCEHSPSLRMEWMNVIVERAQSAPLCISGYVWEKRCTSLFDAQQCFFKLLESSWERIERLSVCIYGLSNDKEVLHSIQTVFLSRAPNLNLFDVWFSTKRDNLILNTLPPKSLFVDDAPLLRQINTGLVAYKLDSPWLSGIREISPFPEAFNLEDIFILLQSTPVIEFIGMKAAKLVFNQTLNSFLETRINLPKLSSIRLEKPTVTILARILNYIRPGRLFIFYIDVWDSNMDLIDETTLNFLENNLAYYISNYFTTNSSTTVLVGITNTVFKLRDVAQSSGRVSVKNFNVVMQTLRSRRGEWNKVVTRLFNAIINSGTVGRNPSLFESIKEIRLIALEVEPTMIHKLRSTLPAFQHIRHLKISEHALCKLSRIEKAGGGYPGNILFPELHTISLLSLQPCDNKLPPSACTDLAEFFVTRRRIGCPVAKFDLTNCCQSDYAKDLRSLEAVYGLEVVWRKQDCNSAEDYEIPSYTCESGNPEKLINRGSSWPGGSLDKIVGEKWR